MIYKTIAASEKSISNGKQKWNINQNLYYQKYI